MDKAIQAAETIGEQRKLPQDIKDKLNNITFTNLLVSIGLMLYFLAINLIYLNEPQEIFVICVRVFSMALAIIDVVIFEIGYRKENILLWIHGFELLVCGLIVLSVQYFYLYFSAVTRNMIMLSPLFFSIYYVGKLIVIHIIETQKYQNNLSDVKEIIKEEEESYIDEFDSDSEKLQEEVNEVDEKVKQEKEIIKKAKKEKKKVQKEEKKND